jgi:hypothetical protein
VSEVRARDRAHEGAEQLDELIRLAQAPVIKGDGGALDLEQGPEG